jgi:hypothetical protein
MEPGASRKKKCFAVSRQMVLFAVERRKAWRMLQSKAGVTNKDSFGKFPFRTEQCAWFRVSCSSAVWPRLPLVSG